MVENCWASCCTVEGGLRRQQLNDELEDVGISQPWKTENKLISSCRIHFSLHCTLYSDFTIAVASESCDDFLIDICCNCVAGEMC